MPRPKKKPIASAPPPPSPDSDEEDGVAQSRSGSNVAAIFSNWPPEECARLVDYIKKNGFDGDVKKLCEHFPGHTETNIRHFMAELCPKPGNKVSDKVAGKFGTLQEQARLNSLSQSYGSVLPTFVEWKAILEDHPDPNEVGGIDYPEIYRAIAALMRGEVPRALNRPTSEKFLQIIDRFLVKLKSPRPEVVLPKAFKKPVSSTIKTRQQCNVTLANRRSTNWSQSEFAKAERLLKADVNEVREIYLTPAWANPFRFPDERPRCRLLKTTQRKDAIAGQDHEVKKRTVVEDVSGAEQGQAAKKRRRRRK